MTTATICVAGLVALAGLFPRPAGVNAYRADTPPVVDGVLDDACWKNAETLGPFVDIRGGTNATPRFATTAQVTWHGDTLYIAARLEEPDVRASLKNRDDIIYRDNDFEVFIDPDGDGANYFEIELNAYNTVFDLFLQRPYRTRGPVLFCWDAPGLRTAVHVNGTLNDASDRDCGWTLEMAIPQRAVAIEGKNALMPGAVWRMNFSRVQWVWPKKTGVAEDNWVWSPQGKIAMHEPEHWGYVRFVDGPRTPFVYPEEEPIHRALYAAFKEVLEIKKMRMLTEQDRKQIAETYGVAVAEESATFFMLSRGTLRVNANGELSDTQSR